MENLDCNEIALFIFDSKCYSYVFVSVSSCIQGKLVEVNEELLSHPNLLSETVGILYLCMILYMML